MEGKVVCQKHYRAHLITEPCIYCEAEEKEKPIEKPRTPFFHLDDLVEEWEDVWVIQKSNLTEAFRNNLCIGTIEEWELAGWQDNNIYWTYDKRK